jgi:hypothetical protein
MEKQHLVLWRVPCSTQRQARELISGPDLATRVVIGLLTGHSTLRRHLYIMGLSNNPICRQCGTEGETSVHISFECEALASLRHTYLGSFFLDTENIRKLSIGAIWNFAKGTGLLQLGTEHGAQRANLEAYVYVHRTRKGSNPNTIQFHSITLHALVSHETPILSSCRQSSWISPRFSALQYRLFWELTSPCEEGQDSSEKNTDCGSTCPSCTDRRNQLQKHFLVTILRSFNAWTTVVS